MTGVRSSAGPVISSSARPASAGHLPPWRLPSCSPASGIRPGSSTRSSSVLRRCAVRSCKPASRGRLVRILRGDPDSVRGASWHWPVQAGSRADFQLTLLDGDRCGGPRERKQDLRMARARYPSAGTCAATRAAQRRPQGCRPRRGSDVDGLRRISREHDRPMSLRLPMSPTFPPAVPARDGAGSRQGSRDVAACRARRVASGACGHCARTARGLGTPQQDRSRRGRPARHRRRDRAAGVAGGCSRGAGVAPVGHAG